jgi:hypothetical protein
MAYPEMSRFKGADRAQPMPVADIIQSWTPRERERESQGPPRWTMEEYVQEDHVLKA